MASNGVRGGYWLSCRANKFLPSKISKFFFTHLFYASVVPNSNSNYQLTITPGSDDDKLMREFTDEIKKRKNQVSLLSIGGHNKNPNVENDVCAIFSSMASDQGNRKNFIASSISVARNYGFDGLDLDWEFPKSGEQMQNLSLLFQEWHDAILEDAKSPPPGKTQLLLSAAVYYAYDEVNRPYPIEAIKNCVDFVGPRCYDYYGNWDTTVTAEHACLTDPKPESILRTEYGINSWIKAGLPVSKLVMGLPLFGKTWHLKDPKKNDVGDPADGVGTGEDGVMTYDEIENYIKANKNTINKHYHLVIQSMYCSVESNWIGYEDSKTIAEKVVYAKNRRIGGYFLWALGFDHEDSATQAGISFYILIIRYLIDSFIYIYTPPSLIARSW